MASEVSVDRLERASQLAGIEARRAGSRQIDVEHLLIGVAQDTTGAGAQILRDLKLNSTALIAAARQVAERKTAIRPTGTATYAAENSIQLAGDEATLEGRR